MSVPGALEHELTPVPLSLFNKDQLMRKANKADFAKSKLKSLTIALHFPPESPFHVVADGGWLLYQVKWEEGDTWEDIVNKYVSFILKIVRQADYVTVVFDGYHNSPKDHDHLRRTKHLCGNLTIQPQLINMIPREKFLDNLNNKAQLIELLCPLFEENNINVTRCHDDADTMIVTEALMAATSRPVEVRIYLYCL